MSFPSTQYSSDATAQAGFVNAALTKGLTIDGLTVQGQLYAACANMLVTAPADSVNLVDINDYGADGGYIRSNGSAWVRTSGFALADATGTLAGANGGTGVANTSKTITLGGNLATSGAFALTMTLTGTTGVTLPTSGTLATTAGNVATATALANARTIGGVSFDGTVNITVATATGSFTVTGAFGCNGATARTAATIGAALAAYSTGVFGLDSSANMQALYDDVVAIRAALVLNGVLAV